MKQKEPSILLSEKHGVNPSLLHCIACGKEYGLALLGKLKDDAQAPREIYQGLCPDCEKVVKSGGIIIIETVDGATGNNPERTGRLVGCSKDFKDRNNLPNSIMYMHHKDFQQIFKDVAFQP